MDKSDLIQKVRNDVMTWSNNRLFSKEHSIASKVSKEEKQYDHILYIPKEKGVPITLPGKGVERLEWESNTYSTGNIELSDHWLIYTMLNIGGENLTVGSFNIQNLLGLDEDFYERQHLVNYFSRASQMKIDIIGIQELGKSHKIGDTQKEGIDIISDILGLCNAKSDTCEYKLYYENIQGKNPTTTAIIYNSKKLSLTDGETKKREESGKKSKGATRAKISFKEKPDISFYFVSTHLVSKKSCELSTKFIFTNAFSKICNAKVRKQELERYISCLNTDIDVIIVGDFNTQKVDEIIKDVAITCKTGEKNLGGKRITTKMDKKKKYNLYMNKKTSKNVKVTRKYKKKTLKKKQNGGFIFSPKHVSKYINSYYPRGGQSNFPLSAYAKKMAVKYLNNQSGGKHKKTLNKNYIIKPKTNRKVSVNGILGKKIIKTCKK